MAYDNGKNEKKISSSKVHSELDNLSRSIEKIMNTMKEMEVPLRESRQQLPRASLQLGKIHTQTEEATHRMLDRVEQIVADQDNIRKLSDQIKALLKSPKSVDKNKYIEIAGHIFDMALASQQNAYLIEETLQFQDVTSQQMEHASELLKEVERRLHHLQSIIAGAGASEEAAAGQEQSSEANRPLYERKDQKEVDIIFSKIVGKNV